jgi:AcrR family transcriptional regulator
MLPEAISGCKFLVFCSWQLNVHALWHEAFTRLGEDASLDDVAKQPGVGAGTLYRHFPSREALIEAVYRTEVEKLAAAEQNFAETMAPVQALRAWMLLFVDYIATKKIIAPALNTLVGGHSKVFEASYTQIWEAIRALVKRAIKTGDIRKDLDPIDLFRALIGVSNRPVLTGSKALGDWWISLSPVRGRSNRYRDVRGADWRLSFIKARNTRGTATQFASFLNRHEPEVTMPRPANTTQSLARIVWWRIPKRNSTPCSPSRARSTN